MRVLNIAKLLIPLASIEHASISLQDNKPICYRVVYTVFTIIHVSGNLFIESSPIIEGFQDKITLRFIPICQKFIEPSSYRFHDFCCCIIVPSFIYLLREYFIVCILLPVCRVCLLCIGRKTPTYIPTRMHA